MQQTTVLVIDDHQMVPAPWRQHLHKTGNYTRDATRDRSAIRDLIQQTQPCGWGIITLRELSEYDLLTPLRRWLPQAVLVAITADDSLHSHAYAAGIEYVASSTQLEWPKLHQQVDQVLQQRAQQRLNQSRTRKVQPLNTQQRQILHYVAHGMSNKQISRATCLAEGTVRNHLIRIFDYLGVTNRTQAALRAAPHV